MRLADLPEIRSLTIGQKYQLVLQLEKSLWDQAKTDPEVQQLLDDHPGVRPPARAGQVQRTEHPVS